MRPIIQNDKARIFTRLDNAITARSKCLGDIAIGATTLPLINAGDFAKDAYLLIENIENERAEIIKIGDVTGNTITLATATEFYHNDKTDIFRIEYNQARLYENNTLKATADLQPDYYTSFAYTVTETNYYNISFYNSTSSKESPKGETVYGYEHALCGIGDVSQYEPANIIGGKILDKIDLASRVIRAKFTTQDQTFTDLANRELLRDATALLALHYYFFELKKAKDDISSIKAADYDQKYSTEIERVSRIINKTENNVKLFGQSFCSR